MRIRTWAREPAVDRTRGSASVVSESFVPNVQSSLDIQVFFRRPQPVPRFASGSKGNRAESRMFVARSWSLDRMGTRRCAPRTSRPSGLDKARLRFELMTPGVLWIDDLHIRGETTSRSARLNAQRYAAGGLAGLSRTTLCRLRAAGGVALDPPVEHGGHRPVGARRTTFRPRWEQAYQDG